METQEPGPLPSTRDNNESFGLTTSTLTSESENESQEPEPKRFKIDENISFQFHNCSVTFNMNHNK